MENNTQSNKLSLNDSQNYNFSKVDFNNLNTILYYGKDVLDEMRYLMENISEMMKKEEPLDEQLDEIIGNIGNIGNFTAHLNEREKSKSEKNMLTKPNSLTSMIGKAVTRFLPNNASEKNQTYLQQYEHYNQDIDFIVRNIEKQKRNVLVDIEIYRCFIEKLEPIIIALENLINVGYQDKDNYEKFDLANMEIENSVNQSYELSQKIIIAKQKLDLFSNKLLDLKKSLMLARNTAGECSLKQGPNMELVLMYESYTTTVVPSLKIQAASVIGVRKQNIALQRHRNLVENTNNVFLKNSEMLIDNVKQAGDLSVSGNIKMETLTQLSENLTEGLNLLKTTNLKRVEERERSLSMLSTITSELDKFKSEISRIITSESVITSDDTSIDLNRGYQKARK